MNQFWYYFKNGIINENPVLRLMVGICSVLAVSVKVENCLAMSAAVTFVTVCSSEVISSMRKIVHDEVGKTIIIIIKSTFIPLVTLLRSDY